MSSSDSFKVEFFNIRHISPGMKVAQEIKDKNGAVLIGVDKELTEKLIEKLKNLYITEIPIYVPKDPNENTLLKVNINDVLRKQIQEDIKKSNYHNIRREEIKLQINELIKDLIKDDGLIVLLVELRGIGKRVYFHSLNVCVFSLLVAYQLKYPPDRLITIAKAALLHDIGKRFISKEVAFAERQSQREREQYEKHVALGAEYLSRSNYCNAEISKIVFEHHERLDGSGFPARIKGDAIHKMAQIISIADTLDIMLYKKERPYAAANEAVEFFLATGGMYFNFEYVKILLQEIVIYKPYDWIILNTGETGFVTKLNESSPLRPVVTILFDKESKKYKLPKVIDLSIRNYATLAIVDILE